MLTVPSDPYYKRQISSVSYLFLIPRNDYNNRRIPEGTWDDLWDELIKRFRTHLAYFSRLPPIYSETPLYTEETWQISVILPAQATKLQQRAESFATWVINSFSQQEVWIKKHDVKILSSLHKVWTGICTLEENVDNKSKCKRKILELMGYAKNEKMKVQIDYIKKDIEERYGKNLFKYIKTSIRELKSDRLIELNPTGYFKLTDAGIYTIENDPIIRHAELGFYLGILSEEFSNSDAVERAGIILSLQSELDEIFGQLLEQVPNTTTVKAAWSNINSLTETEETKHEFSTIKKEISLLINVLFP